MAIVKQPVDISFAQGLDTKTDPWRVPIGKFLSLENMVFTVGERLTKRNGYGSLKELPELATFLTTFNQNLTAIGKSVQAFIEGTGQWLNKGALQPVELVTLPLIRSDLNQSQVDAAISSSGLVCTVYTDQTPSSPATPRYMYAIADSVTGQNVVEPTVIPVTIGVVTGSPRVFVLGAYFIIVFTNDIAGTFHLQYIAVSISNPSISTLNADITSNYTPSPGLSWDGVVVNNNLYVAYNTAAGGQSIKITYITSTLLHGPTTTFSNSGKVTATLMSVTADISNLASPRIYSTYYNSGTSTGYTFAVDLNLNPTIAVPVEWVSSGTIDNIGTVASGGY